MNNCSGCCSNCCCSKILESENPEQGVAELVAKLKAAILKAKALATSNNANKETI